MTWYIMSRKNVGIIGILAYPKMVYWEVHLIQRKDEKFNLHGTFQQIDYYSELARVRVIVHP